MFLTVAMAAPGQVSADAALAAAQSRTPQVSSAGTSPAIQGNERGGRIRIGTGGTSGPILVTWARALSGEPQCWVQNETDAVDVRARANQTALQIRIGSPLAANAVLKYGCSAE